MHARRACGAPEEVEQPLAARREESPDSTGQGGRQRRPRATGGKWNRKQTASGRVLGARVKRGGKSSPDPFVRTDAIQTPPGARPSRREVRPSGWTRAARPVPRVGRTNRGATRGPDEWLLPSLVGRRDRIRLTDLLRRTARRGVRFVEKRAGAPSVRGRTGARRTRGRGALLARISCAPRGVRARALRAQRSS